MNHPQDPFAIEMKTVENGGKELQLLEINYRELAGLIKQVWASIPVSIRQEILTEIKWLNQAIVRRREEADAEIGPWPPKEKKQKELYARQAKT